MTTIHGYLRVSTREQAESGAGLAAQRLALEHYTTTRGLTVTCWHVDAGVSSTVAPARRPALSTALRELRRGDVLLVPKLDRLLRRMIDLVTLRDLADRGGWTITAADGTVDLGTPYGRAFTNIVASMAELERDLTAQRTRDALQARKAAGSRLGRPVTLPATVRQRVVDARASGQTLQQIADALNDDQVPTARGGRSVWWGSTVRQVLGGVILDELAAANAVRA